ncbi:M28 family metallopeptidase [Halalkalicoccus sp. NIPERK01]|uniref:M28 family metallopeptidase n=1 Tax=Halalkalicoccus sp. NIPERK01 TaxID=3053469 RepID=UPI00256EBF3A|nr:M28 family metallopeptidase [Halalkalicoccus sp. NIPERK01]MDL5362410.1 M28 family metallopeptidase [Halalkalicoccus sp. NIPERK01]
MTELDTLLGRAWHDDSAWELLTRLTELPERMGGHPGERRAAEHVADAFEDGGVEGVEIEEFEMWRWDRGRAALAVTDPVERSFETLALPYSPAGEVSAELVDVGYGTPGEIEDADVAGKIAVASTTTPPEMGRFVHRMEKFGHAVAAGAEAFVFANHVPGQLPPTGALRFNGEAAAPGVGVSKETGAWLTDYAERGGRAKLSVEASTEEGTSQNVHGTLGEGGEEIVLVGHYDAHDIAEGALDNGCGISVVAGAARLLSEMDLDCRVRVAGVGCEEVGLMGADALAESLPLDSVRAVVNVDGAGRFRNLKAYTHGSERIEDLVRGVCGEWGQPVSFSRDPHPYSDHWPFLQRGVPALQLHSERARPAGGVRGRGWGHTHADTREKVDPRNLREHAMLAALLVRELTEIEVPRIDESELRERLEESDAEAGMRAAEVWPDHWE